MSLQQSFFISTLLVVTLAFLWLISGFMMPIFWAATLAIIFYPVQQKAEAVLGERRSLASLLTLLVILFTVIVPTMLLVSAVASEAATLYSRIDSGELNPTSVIDWVQRMMPQAIAWLDEIGVDVDNIKQKLSQLAVTGSQFVGTLALTVGQNAVRFTVMFFLMLYLLFFFLRDGEQVRDTLVHVLPLGDSRERELFAKFAEVSRATVKGTLLIGAIQGALGGIMFAVLGIEGAVFWGVVMTVLSLLPVVGASLVWGPAAIYFAVSGDWARAVTLLVFGAVVIGLIDNLLRPLLVGRDTRIPDYLVLLSTLGGLGFFGISGFVIGPIIAALFLTLWVMFGEDGSFAAEHGD